MSPNSDLTPPLESFSGIPALLQRFLLVCIRVMPILLVASAAVGAAQTGFQSLSPWIQQAGVSWQFAFLILALLAAWTLLLSMLSAFVSTVVSVALGATTIPLGHALTVAVRRLPRVVGYSFLAMCTIAAGLLFLILPGLYLILRLFPVAQVALFEPNVNVFQRSWELTQHRTLEVFISYLGVLVATFIPSLAIGITIGFLPSIPGLIFLANTLEVLLTYTLPLVFWLLLYGWFRADTYVPPVAGPEEAYAEA